MSRKRRIGTFLGPKPDLVVAFESRECQKTEAEKEYLCQRMIANRDCVKPLLPLENEESYQEHGKCLILLKRR